MHKKASPFRVLTKSEDRTTLESQIYELTLKTIGIG